jgi:hypothetical protein
MLLNDRMATGEIEVRARADDLSSTPGLYVKNHLPAASVHDISSAPTALPQSCRNLHCREWPARPIRSLIRLFLVYPNSEACYAKVQSANVLDVYSKGSWPPLVRIDGQTSQARRAYPSVIAVATRLIAVVAFPS